MGKLTDQKNSKKFVDKVLYSNSLDGYIEKYGEIDGRSKYLEMRTSRGCKFGVSPISQELFKSIKHEGREYYAELNHEYFLITKCGYFYIDYVNKDRMKAVEFNGDMFHANPKIFKKDDRPNPFDKSKTSEDIWKYEEIKMKAIREAGFEILVIWEKDYIQNKNLVVE